MSASTSSSGSPEPGLRAALALSLARGVGPARQRALIEEHGSAAAALRARPAAEARSLERTAEALLADVGRAGIVALHTGDERYPERLRELDDAPAVIWTIGDLALLGAPMVAIVGTRRCTAYGERVTRELATALARAGVCVVSGMALGIDAAAHESALVERGRTIAVLGTGVDVPYPAGHRALHARLANDGLLISEALPGAPARPGAFPRRNRLIAALAPVLIVVEAGTASGALITARVALDLGRTIAAVPGPIDQPQSAGSNELLRDGAVVIATIDDALALVGATSRTYAVHAEPVPDDPDSAAVWRTLAGGALDMDALCAHSRLPAARCLQAVTMLELAGRVECALTGEIRRR
ncbi:MAG TPA: DNA-processing protein DprA [Gemmatimonadaceae bacterium]|nr:DNA-processing protein DprA [Gemmatimonadaceae bacterium]